MTGKRSNHPIFVLVAIAITALLVTGCGRSRPPAPVVYKGTAPQEAPGQAQRGQAQAAGQSAASQKAQPRASRAALAQPGPKRAGASSVLGEVVVRRGDTLFSVARRYRVALRELIERNRLRPPYHLVVGQRLRLPAPREHVVAEGDTVYGISRRYGVDMTALVRLNAIKPPYTIAVGRRLRLPASIGAATLLAASSGRPGAGAGNRAYGVSPLPETSMKSSAKSLARNPRAAPAGKAAAKGRGAGRRASLGPPPRTASGFAWPLRGKILSAFGPKNGGLHNDGINIAAKRGMPVKAAKAGIVAYAGNELRGFGNLVLIKHAKGWVTAYAHNNTLLVRRGDRVRRGQTIARAGSTGNVSSPQLHFEIRRGTRAVNPRRHLTALTTAKKTRL